MSKIDARLLADVVVVKGPYRAIYGPGFDFIDFELLGSPRYEDGYQLHGTTSIDYQSNGEQWYGRQSVIGGDDDSGFRFSYGHKTGNDYVSGDGTGIPSSYKSRDIQLVYGQDLSAHSRMEFSLLRVDQTDVELPGQAFDLDYLVTDAYEIRFIHDGQTGFDRFELATWYNRTELSGSAQREGKRTQLPFYDRIDFSGVTDADAMSTGYTAAWTWEDDVSSVTAGTDLRYTRQELNEITSGDIGATFWRDRNSPIPRSHVSNPGVFWERRARLSSDLTFIMGSRLDSVSANVDDDAAKLNDVAVRGARDQPLGLAEVVGSGDFDRDFMLGSTFVIAELRPTQHWLATLSYGYAERAPTTTELYAAQPFMFLLQNGLNTVTGDPELKKERLWQLDVGLNYDNGRLRTGINGFHAWVRDYITFENLRTFPPNTTSVEQVGLKFVNTDLATLAGGEFSTEYDCSSMLPGFAALSFVEGRDHARNGGGGTEPAAFGRPNSTASRQDADVSRGAFSGVSASDEEPLPNIGPLEARLGLRLHDRAENPRWSVELSARIVDEQHRVATSLLESPTAGFTICDLRGYARASENLLLIAGVENFTDKQYREYLDFRSPGRSALTVFQPGVNFYFGSELNY